MALSYEASLNILKLAEPNKEAIANKFGFVPLSKLGKPLKAGGKAYNAAVMEEVIRRATAHVGTRRTLEESRTHVPVEGSARTTTSLIRGLDRYKNVAKYLVETHGNKNLRDLYNSIMREQRQEIILREGAVYVNLIFEHDSENKSRVVAVPNDILQGRDGYENFLIYIEELESGGLTKKLGKQSVGSDAVNYNEYRLLLNKFIITTHKITVGGSSADIVYNCVGISSEQNLCGYECLARCIGAENITKPPKYFQNFENLLKYIDENDLMIRVIPNIFTIRAVRKDGSEVGKLLESRGDPIYLTKKIGSKEVKYPAYPIDPAETECGYIYHPDGNSAWIAKYPDKLQDPRCATPEHIIIYDEINQHVDLYEFSEEEKSARWFKGLELGNCVPQLKKDVYLTGNNGVVRNQKILFTAKQIVTATACPMTELENWFVFFDYETVIDYKQSNCMQAYSLSILFVNELTLKELELYDSRGDQRGVNSIRTSYCQTFTGFDCSQQFIRWIIENEPNRRMTFIGFNNTNFDNFIFLDALLTRNDSGIDETNVTNVFYNGSQLLNFTLNGRHNTFDIHKHLMGSLKTNCENFKIQCCSKKTLDHDEIQLLYKEGKLLDHIQGNSELKEYNEYDVLSTAVLFYKYRDALHKIGCTEAYSKDLHNIKTVGSLIYKVLVASCEKAKIEFPQLDFQQYTDLQRSKIAGRVEMFNGVQKVEERLASTDVCSLYPYVMSILNCHYPCGKIKKVPSYQGDDVLGFYYCDIDQSCLKGRNLPNIYAYKTGMENKWDHVGVIENYLLSNVMIGLLLKFGCTVTIRDGFIFTKKEKSCDMFGFLLDLMKAKNQQDDLKKAKNSKYNAALRETIKLLANSVSGKIIEGLHTEKTVVVESTETYLAIKEKAKSINFINMIGDKLFLTYEMSAESMIKQQRPIYLGVLVYDYAKRYMYENSYSKIGLDRLLYTDTDASKFRYTDMARWRDWIEKENVIVPHWPEVEAVDPRYKTHLIYDPKSKVFGSFEDELDGCLGDTYTFYCLEKKSWFYGWGKAGVKDHKYRFKGINGGTQVLGSESFIKTKTMIKDGVQISKKYIGAEEGEPEEAFEERLHEFFVSNKANSLDNKAEEFFENIYRDGHAYVLCTSFRKIVKNSARNVGLDDTAKHNGLVNKIQVNVMMKKIAIKR